jgi:large subunit ribosomal protein L9
MQVILMEDVPKLGTRGQTVNVKDGYARNYLIPRGVAVPLGSGKASNVEHQKKLADDRLRTQIKESKSLADQLNELSIEIPVLVGEEDKMYGSVTNADIAEALAEKGIEVDRHKIEMESHIRALGVYTVTVHLGPEIVATPKVWVVKQPPQKE